MGVRLDEGVGVGEEPVFEVFHADGEVDGDAEEGAEEERLGEGEEGEERGGGAGWWVGRVGFGGHFWWRDG